MGSKGGPTAGASAPVGSNQAAAGGLGRYFSVPPSMYPTSTAAAPSAPQGQANMQPTQYYAGVPYASFNPARDLPASNPSPAENNATPFRGNQFSPPAQGQSTQYYAGVPYASFDPARDLPQQTNTGPTVGGIGRYSPAPMPPVQSAPSMQPTQYYAGVPYASFDPARDLPQQTNAAPASGNLGRYSPPFMGGASPMGQMQLFSQLYNNPAILNALRLALAGRGGWGG